MRRLDLAVAALVLLCLAGQAAAQTARASGIVRDASGHPVRGAVVRAMNEQAHPPQITSTTDDKGRWAMIGLATGSWQFVIEAAGFVTQSVAAPVRVAAPATLAVTMARDLGPIPNALDKGIAQQVTDANTMRDQGRFDQALAAYQEIRTKNPRLTAISLVLGDTYRRKAAQERDPSARTALLQQAINSYSDVLKVDASNERAKTEIESTRAEVGSAPGVK
jgi:tetratricopeptide (TPR) repeat protein